MPKDRQGVAKGWHINDDMILQAYRRIDGSIDRSTRPGLEAGAVERLERLERRRRGIAACLAFVGVLPIVAHMQSHHHIITYIMCRE